MHIDETLTHQPVVAGILAISGGRVGATAAALIALVGAVIGGLALARSTGRIRSDRAAEATGGPGGSTLALALGLTGIVLGALFVVTADGGLGSGNGLGGAVVAVALGLIATVLGGLARASERKVA